MFRIYPDTGKYIPDVLPNGKKIENVTDMPLNRAEFLKCKAYATICALVGEPPKEVIVNTKTYEEAVAVFNGMKDTVEEIQKAVDEIAAKNKVELPESVAVHASSGAVMDSVDIKSEKDETELKAEEPLPEADNTEKEFIPEENESEETVEPELQNEEKKEVQEESKDEEVEESEAITKDEKSVQHNDNSSQKNLTQNQQTGYTSFDKKRNTQNKNKKNR